jgi:hypothetical protein
MKYNTLFEALKNIKPEQKVTFGSRDHFFHLIEKDDRDYNTPFSYTKENASRLGEQAIKENDFFVLSGKHNKPY